MHRGRSEIRKVNTGVALLQPAGNSIFAAHNPAIVEVTDAGNVDPVPRALRDTRWWSRA